MVCVPFALGIGIPKVLTKLLLFDDIYVPAFDSQNKIRKSFQTEEYSLKWPSNFI